MKVLSLFDGMSCGRIALDRAVIEVNKYYASEIDRYAEKVSAANYPDIIRLGDITKWKEWNIEQPDIIIAGSPCQGFSFAGKQLNFNDPRSALFFTFIDILKHYKPKYFLLENVIMKKEYNDVISGILGELYPECISQGELFRAGRLDPIEINSALVSAQNRRRLYWTNIQGIEQPKDKGIFLKDILEDGATEKEKSYCIDANYFKGSSPGNYIEKSRRQLVKQLPHGTNKGFEKEVEKMPSMTTSSWEHNNLIQCGAIRGRNPENPSDRNAGIKTEQRLEINKTGKSNTLTSVQKDNILIIAGYADINGNESIKRVYSQDGKAPTLTAVQGGNQEAKTTDDGITWRKLTPLECERLQTVPDNYTLIKKKQHNNMGKQLVSNSQRYKMLGNGWTVDVIAHILGYTE
jgi:site-specific DNA-cytosine methylase